MHISHTYKPVRACLIGITAVLAIGLGSTAMAFKPEKINFGPNQGLGFPLADCGTFQVLNDFTSQGHFVLHFDKDGNVTRVYQHVSYSDSTYYNSEFPDVRIDGGPGEGENDHVDFTGDEPVIVVTGVLFKITIPGHGVIFHEAGRTIFDYFTDEILFQAGPADFSEENLAALCEALTP